MGEAIALMGLAAALPPLIGCGLSTVDQMADIVRTFHSASELSQEWKDRLQIYRYLGAGIEKQLVASHIQAGEAAQYIRKQAEVLDGQLRDLGSIEQGRFAQMLNRFTVLRRRRRIADKLSSIGEQTMLLHQLSMLHLLQQNTSIPIGNGDVALIDTDSCRHMARRQTNFNAKGTKAGSLIYGSGANEEPLLLETSGNGSHEFAPSRFSIEHTTSSLPSGQQCPLVFPFHDLNSSLRLVDAEFLSNIENAESIHVGRSLLDQAISILWVLSETYPENQVTSRDFGAAVSATSRVAQFIIGIGNVDKAKDLIDRTMNWFPNTLASHRAAFATLQANLAIAERYAGDLEAAAGIENEVLRIKKEIFDADHVETLHSSNNYALALQALGKVTQAMDIHSTVLSAKEKLFGRTHPDTLVTIYNIGLCHQDLNQYAAAENRFNYAHRWLQSPGENNQAAVLSTMSCLGNSFYFQGRLEEAETMHSKCLDGRVGILGADHPDTWRTKEHLAIVLHCRNRRADAENMLCEVIAAFRKLLGFDNPDTIKAQLNLSRMLTEQCRYEAAEFIIRKCLKIAEERFKESNPMTFDLLRSLAINLHWQDKYAEALEIANRVHDHFNTEASLGHVEQLEEHLRLSLRDAARDTDADIEDL